MGVINLFINLKRVIWPNYTFKEIFKYFTFYLYSFHLYIFFLYIYSTYLLNSKGLFFYINLLYIQFFLHSLDHSIWNLKKNLNTNYGKAKAMNKINLDYNIYSFFLLFFLYLLNLRD